MLFILTLLVTLFLLIWFVAERLRLESAVKKVQVRVHVNGTRGKSTVTRLLAAGLRGSGRVMAKITGVEPMVIFPDASVKYVKRRGNPRVTEQFRFFQFAVAHKANITVLENMSITPALQQLESKFLRPDIYIITNIRDDHREVMGNSVAEQAGCIIGAIPQGCTVFTGDEPFIPLLERKCDEEGSILKYLMPPPKNAFSSLPAHLQENCNLALNVLRYLHIDEEKAIALLTAEAEAIYAAEQPVASINEGLTVVDLMAINDVPSLKLFLQEFEARNGALIRYSVLLNTRYDRPLRTVQFCDFLAADSRIEKLLLSGSHAPFASNYLTKKRAAAAVVQMVAIKSGEGVQSFASGNLGSHLFLLGNIHGSTIADAWSGTDRQQTSWVAL